LTVARDEAIVVVRCSRNVFQPNPDGWRCIDGVDCDVGYRCPGADPGVGVTS
jgi:hypothetical protein